MAGDLVPYRLCFLFCSPEPTLHVVHHSGSPSPRVPDLSAPLQAAGPPISRPDRDPLVPSSRPPHLPNFSRFFSLPMKTHVRETRCPVAKILTRTPLPAKRGTPSGTAQGPPVPDRPPLPGLRRGGSSSFPECILRRRCQFRNPFFGRERGGTPVSGPGNQPPVPQTEVPSQGLRRVRHFLTGTPFPAIRRGTPTPSVLHGVPKIHGGGCPAIHPPGYGEGSSVPTPQGTRGVAGMIPHSLR